MKNTSGLQKSRNTKAPLQPGAGGRSTPARPQGLTVGPSGARWVGEHLGCSPCGELACRARVAHGWPGPEVLLSLLPLATLHYTVVTIFQEFGAARCRACWRRLSCISRSHAARVASAAACDGAAISSATVSSWIRQHRALQVALSRCLPISSGPADGCMLSSSISRRSQRFEGWPARPSAGRPRAAAPCSCNWLSSQENRSP